MTGESKLVKVSPAEHARLASQILSPETKLWHFRNITKGVMQDALNMWDDLYKELQDSVTHADMASPEAGEGFKPSCGWPEFLDRMRLVRHYLDFARKFSEKDTPKNGSGIKGICGEKPRPRSQREEIPEHCSSDELQFFG